MDATELAGATRPCPDCISCQRDHQQDIVYTVPGTCACKTCHGTGNIQNREGAAMNFQRFSLPDADLRHVLHDLGMNWDGEPNHVDRAIADAATRAALQAVVLWLRKLDVPSEPASPWCVLQETADSLEAVSVGAEEEAGTQQVKL